MSSDIGAWQGGSFSNPFSSDPWDYGGAKEDSTTSAAASASLSHANVDWRETETAHIFRVDLPGVRKEDLKVEVEMEEDGYFLHISGGRSVEKVVDDSDEGRRVEWSSGSFSRRVRLPENADVEGMKCGLEGGVLTVEIAKEVEMHHQPTNVRYIHVA